jgi:hypothetical protein
MKFVKAPLIALFILIIVGGGVWQFWLKQQVAFAQVATAYGAKQVCSCQFVAERDLDSCLGDFTEDIGAVSFSVSSSQVNQTGTSSQSTTVTASVLGGLIKNQARFEPGLGCTVVKP